MLKEGSYNPMLKNEIGSVKFGSKEYFDILQSRDGFDDETKHCLQERWSRESKDVIDSIKKIEQLLENDHSIEVSNYALARAVDYLFFLPDEGLGGDIDSDVKQEIKDQIESLYLKIKQEISNLIDRISKEGNDSDKELVSQGYYVLKPHGCAIIVIDHGVCQALEESIDKIRKW